MRRMDFFFTIVWFYIGWFGSIFFARVDMSLHSLVFPFILGFYLLLRQVLSLKMVALALGISAIGILFDFLLFRFGLIETSGTIPFLIPIWLISIWLLFSISMVILGPHWRLPVWLTGILGAIVGPLSYKSGAIFNVLIFSSSFTVYTYALFWAFLFPTFIFLTKRST